MQRIIFFDGICPLCNRFVSFVFKYDKKKYFKYAPLQSKTATLKLNKQDLSLDSLVYLENEIVFKKSQAVLRIMFHLNGLFSIFAVLIAVVPGFILDYLYDFVARNRYKLYPPLVSCRIPTEDEKSYFLE